MINCQLSNVLTKKLLNFNSYNHTHHYYVVLVVPRIWLFGNSILKSPKKKKIILNQGRKNMNLKILSRNELQISIY